MDGQRVDTIVKVLHSRRSALSLVVSLSALLGLDLHESTARKCRKRCSPCKRCQRGRCVWKRGTPRCGPCSYCEGGACRRLCPPEDCVTDGGQEICLRDCDPSCDTCSVCNREAGVCDPLCASEICVDGVCQFP